jgi:hypothetical protein
MAVAMAVTGASASAALAQYPPAAGSGAVSATTVPLGDQVDFSGDGFAAGSKVVITVNDAVYATVSAAAPTSSALGLRSSVHFSTAAYVRPVAQQTAASTGSFSVTVTMNKLGKNSLVGSGVDAAGAPRLVTAIVTVTPVVAGVKTTSSGSSLPFTGSSVIIPGAIIGLTMMAGGFVLLTSVRSRRAGSARS